MVQTLRVVRYTLQGGGHVPTAARGVETGGLLTASRLIVRHTLQGGGHVPATARGVETGGLLTASRLIVRSHLFNLFKPGIAIKQNYKYN